MIQNPASKRSRSPRRKALMFLALAAVALLPFSIASCRSTVENRDPLGSLFPSVQGEALDGQSVTLPTGAPTVLLLGYVQRAQFDADRWLVGLLQATPPVRILEVPTIKGLFPRLIGGTIDEGMRSGIPSEDWESVVTIYGSDARQLVEFTGNERGRNIRVLLVDSDGVVRWFHDRGFSAGKLLELVAAAESLTPQ